MQNDKPIPAEVEVRVSDGTHKVQIREVAFVEDWAEEEKIENLVAKPAGFPLEALPSSNEAHRSSARRREVSDPKVKPLSDTDSRSRGLSSLKTSSGTSSSNLRRNLHSLPAAACTLQESTPLTYRSNGRKISAENKEAFNRGERLEEPISIAGDRAAKVNLQEDLRHFSGRAVFSGTGQTRALVNEASPGSAQSQGLLGEMGLGLTREAHIFLLVFVSWILPSPPRWIQEDRSREGQNSTQVRTHSHTCKMQQP